MAILIAILPIIITRLYTRSLFIRARRKGFLYVLRGIPLIKDSPY